jgi:hypothetical protein
VVLYQTLWPMSDIPAGALWTGAVAFALGPTRRDAAAAGLFAALGLLVRPNLLLVAAAPLLLVLVNRRGRERWIDSALICAPVAPVVACVAWLNTLWFGSPGNSGYGAAREIYLLSNVWPNVQLYATWLWESQSPWLLLALVPLVPAVRSSLNRRVVGACVLLASLTFASYVSYSPFEVWWYLRFLMPAFGAFAVLVAAGLVALARAVPQPFGRIAAAVILYLMVATTMTFAAGKGVFGGLRANERRYVDVAQFAADGLPADAAFLAVQHGGSLRFYSGRRTLRFDWVRREWAPGVAAAIERAGYHPYLVVDDFEIPQVRAQFGFAADAPLPWPIVARMRDLGGVTVFDMATNPVLSNPVALEPHAPHPCVARRRGPN